MPTSDVILPIAERAAVSHGREDIGLWPSLRMAPARSGRPRPRSLWQLFLLAFCIQATAVLVSYALGLTKPFFPDPRGQHARAVEIATYWAQHGVPSPGELRQIVVGDAWGLELFQAAIYRLMGVSWLWARLGLGAGAAIGPVAVFAIARRFTTDSRTPMRAFLLAALWPATMFWTVVGQKDGFLGGLALGAVSLVITLPTITGSILALLCALGLSMFRPVAAGAVALAALIAPLVRAVATGDRTSGRSVRRAVVTGSVVVVAGIVILAPRAVQLSEGASTLQYEANGEYHTILEGGIGTRLTTAFRPSVVAKGLLSPLPWKWEPQLASPHRWLFPGALVWIVLLPIIGLGCWRMAREHHPAALILLVWMGGYLAGYYLTFAGEFTRQRAVIEPAGLLIATVTWARWRDDAVAIACVGATVTVCAALVYVLATGA